METDGPETIRATYQKNAAPCRVGAVKYYLLNQGCDEERAIPVCVLFNRSGHYIAAGFPDASGSALETDNQLWTTIRQNAWLEETDSTGFDAALDRIKTDAANQIVMFPGQSVSPG
jgi:hypothetical protein